jgi:hypothetical protein
VKNDVLHAKNQDRGMEKMTSRLIPLEISGLMTLMLQQSDWP